MRGIGKEIRVFITGGTGLLGSHILQEILANTNWQVTALKRASSKLELVPISDRIKWVVGNLFDFHTLVSEMENCSAVIHAAGVISVGEIDLSDLLKVNGEGVGNIIDAALETDIDRFVHVSSVAALGREGKGLINEDCQFEDLPIVSEYARSKYAGDQEAYRGRAEGLSMNIIRPSLILGSGHWVNGSDSVVAKVDTGIPYYPIGGTGIVDVRDVASMIVKMVISEEDELDLICNGHNVLFENLQATIAEHIDVKPPAKPLPQYLIGWISRFERLKSLFSGKPTIITKSSLQRAQNTYFYDNKRSQISFQTEYILLSKTVNDISYSYVQFKKNNVKSLLSIT